MNKNMGQKNLLSERFEYKSGRTVFCVSYTEIRIEQSFPQAIYKKLPIRVCLFTEFLFDL